MAHKIGVNVTVFKLGTPDYKADLIDASLTVDNKSEEGKGIIDLDDAPDLVGRTVNISGNFMISADAISDLMTTAYTATPYVTIDFNTGGNHYTGTAMIKTISHDFVREAIQKCTLALVCQGSLGIA